MKKCRFTELVSVTGAAALVVGLSACSSSSSVDGGGTTASAGSAGAASSAAASDPRAKNIFSNLSELKYTPQEQGSYRIGPNDLIEINVFRVPDLSKETRVDDRGRISLPLVGVMQVGGLTQQQLERQLAQKLAQSYLQNPQVSVFIKEFTSREITVGGSVKSAGVFPMKSSTTLSQAVAMAGGLGPLADPAKVVLFRGAANGGQYKAYNLDLKAIRAGKMKDPYLNGKDQVIVHESGSRVWLQRVRETMGAINPFRL